MPAVARHIKMRDSEEVIKSVLMEFFELRGEYWHSNRADKEISAYASKSEKARKSAGSRWGNANALRTHCDGIATVECDGIATITNTITNTNIKATTTRKKFVSPEPQEVTDYARSIGFELDGEQFVAYYQTRGWKVGKDMMVDWQSAVVTWKKNNKDSTPTIDFVKEV
jgi:uncharacterized protein YdaU (DUF1376 family)